MKNQTGKTVNTQKAMRTIKTLNTFHHQTLVTTQQAHLVGGERVGTWLVDAIGD